MADIRINALATTAASTASDDFVAVDGSANGTRKLNAYSPTFGGNLAVSGTGTFAGAVTINTNASTIGVSGTGTGGNWRFKSDDGNTRWLAGLLGSAGETTFSIYDLVNSRQTLALTAAGNAALAGNLTVSGAGLSAISGNLNVAGIGTFNKSLDNITTEADYAIRIKTSAEDGGLYLGANSTISAIQAIDPGTTFDRKLAIQPNGGNLLIGTTTDGGQKLQVSGSGFITGSLAVGDRAAPAGVSLRVQQAGSDDVGLEWQRTSATNGILLSYNRASSAYTSMSYGASSHTFTISGTTALTLDSSQNATFAGNLTVSGVQNVIGSASPSANFPLRINQGATDAIVTMDIANVSSGTAAAANIQLQTDAGTSFLRQHSAAHSVWPNYLLLGASDNIALNTGTTSNGIELMTGGTTRVNITTATTTVSNTLAINNTVQTAAGVSSTHKVTISIGGTTYYLLATNV